MAQFSVKIMRQTGAVLGENQQGLTCGCTDMVKISEDRAEQLDKVPAVSRSSSPFALAMPAVVATLASFRPTRQTG